MEKEVADLNSQLADKQRKIDQLTTDLENERKARAQVQQTVAEKDNEIAGYKRQIHDLEGKLRRLQQEMEKE
eukprot:gene2158-12105_t